jgi:hypothetical protein
LGEEQDRTQIKVLCGAYPNIVLPEVERSEKRTTVCFVLAVG